jgi:hypothetical protein
MMSATVSTTVMVLTTIGPDTERGLARDTGGTWLGRYRNATDKARSIHARRQLAAGYRPLGRSKH